MALASQPRSPYYPPRARWYSPARTVIDKLSRILALDRLRVRISPEIELLPLIAAFLVPGLGVWLRAPRWIGRAALAAAAFLVFSFLLFLGQHLDNLVFGMLLSLHASGFVYYCTPLIDPRLWPRLLFSMAMLVAILLLVYLPAQALMQAYLFTPMRMHGQLIIVGQIYSPKNIHAGDWIAYSIAGSENFVEGGAYTRSGVDLTPVLAVPGDLVEFSTDSYRVNGVPHAKLPHMPSGGTLRVQQKEWFVWPHLAIEVHYANSDSAISESLMTMCLVTEKQLIGKPFQTWFGRRKITP